MVDGCFGAAGAMTSGGRLGCCEFKGSEFNSLLRGIRELRLAPRGHTSVVLLWVIRLQQCLST